MIPQDENRFYLYSVDDIDVDCNLLDGYISIYDDLSQPMYRLIDDMEGYAVMNNYATYTGCLDSGLL